MSRTRPMTQKQFDKCRWRDIERFDFAAQIRDRRPKAVVEAVKVGNLQKALFEFKDYRRSMQRMRESIEKTNPVSGRSPEVVRFLHLVDQVVTELGETIAQIKQAYKTEGCGGHG